MRIRLRDLLICMGLLTMGICLIIKSLPKAALAVDLALESHRYHRKAAEARASGTRSGDVLADMYDRFASHYSRSSIDYLKLMFIPWRHVRVSGPHDLDVPAEVPVPRGRKPRRDNGLIRIR